MGPKRGGRATASEDPKVSAADRSVNASGATTATTGGNNPSTTPSKSPDLSVKTHTDTEKAAVESSATTVNAKNPSRTWAVVAGSAPGTPAQQKTGSPANGVPTSGKKPGLSYAGALKGPVPKQQSGNAIPTSPDLTGGKSAESSCPITRQKNQSPDGKAGQGEDKTSEKNADSGKGESVAKGAEWVELEPLPESLDPMGMTADPADSGRQIPMVIKEDCIVCCIDLENHCHNQSREEARRGVRSKVPRTCEVGVALADARKLSWDRKGDRWHKAWSAIEGEDYAIKEHKHEAPHHRAYDCGQGRPEFFLYGEPTWVKLAEVKDKVVSRIRGMVEDSKEAEHTSNPSFQGKGHAGDISAPPCPREDEARDKSTPEAQKKEATPEMVETECDSGNPSKSPRGIVFVFFAGKNDLRWLANLGIHLTREFPNSSIVDLQLSFRARQVAKYLNKPQCSFDDYMAALGLENTGAHNGGNDAVHGLRAFLAEIALTAEQSDTIYDGGYLPRLIEEEIPAEEKEIDPSSSSEESKPAVQEQTLVMRDPSSELQKKAASSALDKCIQPADKKDRTQVPPEARRTNLPSKSSW